MRIAFYAPLKAPTHAVPSGDRRVGRLLVDVLRHAGHDVTLASTLRTYEPAGNQGNQARLREEGIAEARRLIARWKGRAAGDVPDLWFTYHVYYKAPDWIGPMVSEALGIPYVIAEASHAPKRAGGAWASGHEAAGHAIERASLVFCPTKDDLACVRALAPGEGRVLWLPPFLDATPYRSAMSDRAVHRARIASRYDLDPSAPWIVAAAMMRHGDKAASYRMLADALGTLGDLPWQFVVAGDGPARAEIERAIEAAGPGRARLLGACEHDALVGIYAACDLCVWPAVNEAYGMAMLEAQAAGLPVVSRLVRGVPDVVRHEITGLLAPADDAATFAAYVRGLLMDPARRTVMGTAAAKIVEAERSLDATAARIEEAIASIGKVHDGRPAAVR